MTAKTWQEEQEARRCQQRNGNDVSAPTIITSSNTGVAHSNKELQHIFYASRFLRRLDLLGYAHFRRWKFYGEATLARHRAVIWIHGESLTVEYEETPLAHYTVQYQPDKKHFKQVPRARRFETVYRSPQGQLWEIDETQWNLAIRLPDYAPRKRRRRGTPLSQLPLFIDPEAGQA